MSEFGATGIGVDDVTDEGNHADAAGADDSRDPDEILVDPLAASAIPPLTEEDVADDITEAEMVRIQEIADLPVGEFIRRVDGASPKERKWLLLAREARHLDMPLPLPQTVFVPREPATEAETNRFRAYARQQAASAYKSALAGSRVEAVQIAVIESVKDAVKYIAKKLHERIDRW